MSNEQQRWVNPVHKVAFRVNPQDESELHYVCATEAALGQAIALANVPLLEDNAQNLVLLDRCRDLLKHLNARVHRWKIPELVPAQQLYDETTRATALETQVESLTLMGTRLATLETPPRAKPKEVKDPDPFHGGQADLKRFKNQLSLVLADGQRFENDQHCLRYCFSLLKGDAYTTMEPYVSQTGVAFADTEAF